VNYARWDLCGGRPAMGVSTAIQLLNLPLMKSHAQPARRCCSVLTTSRPLPNAYDKASSARSQR
jgi:hypothetical protein